jgi:hypothetical protein
VEKYFRRQESKINFKFFHVKIINASQDLMQIRKFQTKASGTFIGRFLEILD